MFVFNVDGIKPVLGGHDLRSRAPGFKHCSSSWCFLGMFSVVWFGMLRKTGSETDCKVGDAYMTDDLGVRGAEQVLRYLPISPCPANFILRVSRGFPVPFMEISFTTRLFPCANYAWHYSSDPKALNPSTQTLTP